jgi:hypothetical protein
MLAIVIMISVIAPQTVTSPRLLGLIAVGACAAMTGTYLWNGGLSASGQGLQAIWLVSIVGFFGASERLGTMVNVAVFHQRAGSKP